jgi:hypothetical protein
MHNEKCIHVIVLFENRLKNDKEVVVYKYYDSCINIYEMHYDFLDPRNRPRRKSVLINFYLIFGPYIRKCFFIILYLWCAFLVKIIDLVININVPILQYIITYNIYYKYNILIFYIIFFI